MSDAKIGDKIKTKIPIIDNSGNLVCDPDVVCKIIDIKEYREHPYTVESKNAYLYEFLLSRHEFKVL